MKQATAPELRVVGSKPKVARDIYAADKAKIAATDWAALHVRGDRSKAIDIPDRPRRPFGLGGW